MYEITVEGRFSAAHRHPSADGDGVHGHDFLVLARVQGGDLEDDVLVDFHEVEVALRAELARLHYSDLDEHRELPSKAATPAAIARWLYTRLAPRVAATGAVGLSSIEVRDTDWTGARYTPPVVDSGAGAD